MGKEFLEAAWRPRGAPLSYLAKAGMKGKKKKNTLVLSSTLYTYSYDTVPFTALQSSSFHIPPYSLPSIEYVDPVRFFRAGP